ncbi:unnamed protein product [Moneuplotes crassus]|uniref:PH domain-containing protein n=1 Tax=Euplotes crassus TaxID=5936 RepID=A0AAD1X3B1_EUPCR|nr:unnamed protein product [Moneuplotes crassus]
MGAVCTQDENACCSTCNCLQGNNNHLDPVLKNSQHKNEISQDSKVKKQSLQELQKIDLDSKETVKYYCQDSQEFKLSSPQFIKIINEKENINTCNKTKESDRCTMNKSEGPSTAFMPQKGSLCSKKVTTPASSREASPDQECNQPCFRQELPSQFNGNRKECLNLEISSLVDNKSDHQESQEPEENRFTGQFNLCIENELQREDHKETLKEKPTSNEESKVLENSMIVKESGIQECDIDPDLIQSLRNSLDKQHQEESDEFNKLQYLDSSNISDIITPSINKSQSEIQKKLLFSTQRNSVNLNESKVNDKSFESKLQKIEVNESHAYFNNPNSFLEDAKTEKQPKSVKVSQSQAINLRLSDFNIQKEKEPININILLLQTERWFTGFGMTLSQLCNPHEKILIEGELYKYKPGIDKMYIARWCQLTKTSFRVYKNQVSAKGFGSKPILALPLEIFKGVKKAKFHIPNKGKDKKSTKISSKNQFEILYRDDILDAIMKNFLHSKINERQDEGNVVELESDDQFEEKISILKDKITSNKVFKVHASMESLNIPSTWSNREGEWFCAEKRLMFTTQKSSDREKWLKILRKCI